MPEQTEVKTFAGSNNVYAEVATKGDQTIGVSLVYMDAGDTTGFAVRFVSKGGQTKFTAFSPRQLGQFKQDGLVFAGVRLDRLKIPVCSPSLPLGPFVKFCDSMQIWEITADWVKEKCALEGFTLIDQDLKVILRGLVEGTLGQEINDDVKLVIDFPLLKKEVQSPMKYKGELPGTLNTDEEEEENG